MISLSDISDPVWLKEIKMATLGTEKQPKLLTGCEARRRLTERIDLNLRRQHDARVNGAQGTQSDAPFKSNSDNSRP